MHLNDSSSIALHLKTHSIPKSKFWKIQVEKKQKKKPLIAHEINKLQLQILEALHIKKQKNPKINRINFEIVTMFWNAFSFFF